MKPTTKRKALHSAILWTVIPVVWAIYTALRLSPREDDSSMLIMAGVTLVLTLVICVISWVRYATFDKTNSDHTTGGNHND